MPVEEHSHEGLGASSREELRQEVRRSLLTEVLLALHKDPIRPLILDGIGVVWLHSL